MVLPPVKPVLFSVAAYLVYNLKGGRVPEQFQITLWVSLAFAVATWFFTHFVVNGTKPYFRKAGMVGRDAHKDGRPEIPESAGLPAGVTYIISILIFIPAVFLITDLPLIGGPVEQGSDLEFSYLTLPAFLSGMLSICCMVLLGFADDVLDLRWRHKVPLPFFATIPMLTVYSASKGSTSVMVPAALRAWLGLPSLFDLGLLYYAWMGVLGIFCTNAINILAGINGLEVGQSVVIGCFLSLFNFLQLEGPAPMDKHLLSIYFLLPFVSSSLALLDQNWCPSVVFVGDTYCYFSGMVFATVGILGHFSKTLFGFFALQLFNFAFSLFQLFGIIPNPRHRMPAYNQKTKLIETSWVDVTERGNRCVIRLLRALRLVGYRTRTVKGKKVEEITNQTVVNLVLLWCGPLREETTTIIILGVQSLLCAIWLAARLALFSPLEN